VYTPRLKEQYDDNAVLEELQKKITELDVTIAEFADTLAFA
jgi:hypothetical protein